jgi:N-formylglutamate amidohydrolase
LARYLFPMPDSPRLLGPSRISSPVFIAVPHAGRVYPDELEALSRLSNQDLSILEDRHADALVEAALASGHHALVADVARAWIDLNRAEDELDSVWIAPKDRALVPTRSTAKVRGGLGVIPTRLAAAGEIWRQPLTATDVQRRIDEHHRPYHHAMREALHQRRQMFGAALLIDLHSMPPVRSEKGEAPPHIVIGDLFRRSADPDLVDLVRAECEAAGFVIAYNVPYAGGATLERHSRPAQGLHAIQVEIDRRLYLDSASKEHGAGLPAMMQFIRRLADVLRQALLDQAMPMAAE